MMASVAASPPAQEGVDLRRLLWAGPLTIAAATAANTLVFLAGAALGAFPASVIIPAAGMPMSLPPVISATVAGVGGGLVAFALTGWLARRPLRLYRAVGLVVLLLSLATPFSVPGAPAGFYAALLLMHLIAGTAAMWLPPRLARTA
jgi:hypothetical protein